MDERQKADVIRLFDTMAKLDGVSEPRKKKKSSRSGGTTIIDSTVVICGSAQIAALLRALARKGRPTKAL